MVLFSDKNYTKLRDDIKELKLIVKSLRGNTITEGQKFQLDFITRQLDERSCECQR